MNLGRRMKELREAKGLTLPELATRAGVSKGYVWKIEKSGETRAARVRPSGETLSKIADALGVMIEELAGLRNNAEDPTLVMRRVVRRTLPDTLQEFVEECADDGEPLSASEQTMLSLIQHKGRRPKTVDDWRFVYESIKRAVRR